MKRLHILLLSCRPLPSTDSWYLFYKQMKEYIVQQGIACELYQICRDKSTDIPIDTYDGFYLPDEGIFKTDRNVAYLSDFIEAENIQVIFNFNHSIEFLEVIKQKFPHLYLFDLIHSRPDLVVQNKKAQLRDMKFSQIRSLKVWLQWFFSGLYLFLLYRIVRKYMRRAYQLFDRTILLSPSYIKEFERVVGLQSGDKLVAIPNPLPVLKDSVQVEEKRKEILFVGRLSVEKALYRLLYIWQKIENKIPDWQLRIVGDGSEKRDWIELSESLGLKNVFFEGFQNAIPYMQKASVICLVSNAEGLPMVFMEAMAMGTVPVGFDSFSAIHDMIEDGKTGFIVPAFDLDQYADKLLELAQNDELRFELGRNAKLAVRKFDSTQVGERWLKVFREVGLV